MTVLPSAVKILSSFKNATYNLILQVGPITDISYIKIQLASLPVKTTSTVERKYFGIVVDDAGARDVCGLKYKPQNKFMSVYLKHKCEL